MTGSLEEIAAKAYSKEKARWAKLHGNFFPLIYISNNQNDTT